MPPVETCALSNSVGPVIVLDEMIGTTAYEVFQSERRKRKPSRTAGGDGLGFSCRQGFKKCDKGFCMASFSSIFQGDHAGVEIATDAHTGLLQSVGLLSHQTRLVSSRPFQGSDLCEGLVIDVLLCHCESSQGPSCCRPCQKMFEH